MHVIIIIALILLFVKIQAWIYNRSWDEKLDVSVCFSRRMVEENEEFQVIETVSNNKRLPLPALNVKFSTSKELMVAGLSRDDNANVSDNFYYSDVVPAMGHKKVVRRIKCYAKRRGVHKINSLFISCDNLLLNAGMHCVRENESKIIVYPAHIKQRGLDYSYDNLLGDVISKLRLLEDPFEFRGIREYNAGDSMKNINWKASAKAEDFLVNQYYQTEKKTITLVCNLSQATGRFEDRLMDECLRLTVSLCEDMLNKGYEIALISNGRNLYTQEPVFVSEGNGIGFINAFNEATATIDFKLPVKELTGFEYTEEIFETQNCLVLISFNQDKKLIEKFSDRITKGLPSYWIVPTNCNVGNTLPPELNGFSGEWRSNEDR